MVRVGDWVKVKMFGYYLVGFVEYVWESSVQITKVARIENGDVQKVSQRQGTFGMEKVELLSNDLQPEDISELIDLALDTRDRQWFEELTRKAAVEVEP